MLQSSSESTFSTCQIQSNGACVFLPNSQLHKFEPVIYQDNKKEITTKLSLLIWCMSYVCDNGIQYLSLCESRIFSYIGTPLLQIITKQTYEALDYIFNL